VYLGAKRDYINTLPFLSFNAWFLGPARVLNPSDISSGSSIFARLTTVTDRPTDRRTTLLNR